jgi:CD109 antigen
MVMEEGMVGVAALGDGMARADGAARLQAAPAAGRDAAESGGLAEVQRVRSYFPETWIWDEVVTDEDGRAALRVEAPDSITTWDLRAVALSPEKGLGVTESDLRVIQPFFLTADLPYSAVRGEELPLKVALYNYLDEEQTFEVSVDESDWFELVGDATTNVTVAANDIGGAAFTVRPKTLGQQLVEVTARGSEAADAVIKGMIVEPEGVAREIVENVVLPAGGSRILTLQPGEVVPLVERPFVGPRMPAPWPEIVPDSARAYVAVSGSLLAQTIEGLDELLQMPFGCGEQNMILFAPDTYILRYLEETRQLKPEIQAKAEMLLVTGYQRELTYQRDDGSFSAFGQSDPEGSLFLTAFVLKTFAQAQDLTYIDPEVLGAASSWILKHQKADGSFEPVGFVAHQEMMGGLQGTDALTAYAAIALLEAGESAAADKAVGYLEDRLATIDDPYTLALVTYALELAGSDRRDAAYDELLAAATEDEEGLHWSSGAPGPDESTPMPPADGSSMSVRPILDVEATGYATLALIEHGDRLDAGKAAKWLVGQRNSQGGFGSTQDTVVALQALTEYAVFGSTDTDLTVTLTAGDIEKQVRVTPDNYDVTQVVEIGAGGSVNLQAEGTGEAVVQGVLRYSISEPEPVSSVFDIAVDYGTTRVDVDDLVDVDVSIVFDPPEPVKAGMVVLDVSVPTGFSPESSTLDALREVPKIKRVDVAGRKVIVYIEDMAPGEEVSFGFQVRASYPVRAKGGASLAYSYYTPEWKGETLGADMVVLSR